MKSLMTIIKAAIVAAAGLTAGVATAYLVDASGKDADIEARVSAAQAASGDFIRQLGGAMKREMQAGGPVAAMKVCRDVAPDITNDISLEKGWKVTRVGTRVRNAMLGTPDAWEQGVLEDFKRRAAAGEQYDDMSHYEVVEDPAGKSLRYMKAIGLGPQCVVCHGIPAQIPEPVQTELQAQYPHDRALRYAPGDLRGAVSIKQPLDD